MESSTAIPDEGNGIKSGKVRRSRDGRTSQSQGHNIAKPLPKTPAASPPAQLQNATLPSELPLNPSTPPIESPTVVKGEPSSSRPSKGSSSASQHGNPRSTSILKVDMVKPGSNWDARLAHGGSRATPVKSRGTSSDNNHQRGGSTSVEHSRAPSSDAEGRRTASGAIRQRGPSLEQANARPSQDAARAPSSSNKGPSISKDDMDGRGRPVAAPATTRRGPPLEIRSGTSTAHHPRTPSDTEGRRIASALPRARVPSLEYQGGRPSPDGPEGPRHLIFDVESKMAGSTIRPVKKRGPSADPENRKPLPSLGSRTPDATTPLSAKPRGHEANVKRPGVAGVGVGSSTLENERRRPGVTASDSGHSNPRTNDPRAGQRGRAAGVSASDNGHLGPQISEVRKDGQGNPARFNSTPGNPPINYRGYTPVPVTNMDDEDHEHGQETSTRFSHEKTLEDMPSFTPSRPYPSEKYADDPEKQKFNKEMRQRRLRILAISSLIIGLLITAIILLVKFVRPKILAATNAIGQGQGTSDNFTLNAEESQCLSDFRANATSSPPTYACSSCLPTLQYVPSQFLQNSSNLNDANDIRSARQFCGLQAVFNSTAQNQGGLSNAGWMKNTQICTWGGVACDSSGAITALNMSFPAVPQTLPPEMSALTTLTNLMIAGDRSVPFGSLNPGLPPSLLSLQLYNTHLEGLETADTSWFQQGGGLSGLTELVLDGNPSLGISLPSGLFGLPLQTLVVRNQQLNMQLDELGNGGGLGRALTTLDLSLNNLTGTMGLLYLPHLTKLDLSNNNLLLIPPILTWPSSLQTVHFQNNPQLNGTLSSSLCGNPIVIDCNFKGTGFSAVNRTCGTCQF